MINVNEIKKLVYFWANKEGMGSISPSEFNLALNSATLGWTTKKYSNDKQYQPGNPIPQTGWQINQRLTDDLKHLLTEQELFVVDGKMKLPNGVDVTNTDGEVAPDYLHASSIVYHAYNNKTNSGINYPVELVMDNEFTTLMSSFVNKPSKRFPKATMREDYIAFLPANLNKVRFNYLRLPFDSFWAYTVEDGEPVYDAENSIHVDAPKDAMNQIALMTLSELGINLRDVDLVNYSQQQETGM